MTNNDAYRLIAALSVLPVQKGTKIEHAKNQTLKNAAKFIEIYNEKLEDLNIEYCSTDDRGNILRDDRGQYIFTKDNQRSLVKELKRFMSLPAAVPFEIVTTLDQTGLNETQVAHLRSCGFVR